MTTVLEGGGQVRSGQNRAQIDLDTSAEVNGGEAQSGRRGVGRIW